MAASRFESDKLFTGTNDERIALLTDNIRVGDGFLASDTGNEYEWTGTSWLKVGVKGATNVRLGDVNNQIVNELFHLHTGDISTIAVAVTSGDTVIELADATDFSVGDTIQINNGNIETTFPTITVIVTNTLTLDRPLDFSYDVGAEVEVVHTDLQTTAGTLALPISHVVMPELGKIWQIHRIIVAMTHPAAATDDKFGSINALTNGVVLRANINGQFGSFTNWKTNGDIILDMFDVTYSDKAGSSLFGTSGRGSFSRIGATVRLDGDAGDYLEILVQDDITLLSSFFVNAQGYIEE